MLTFFNKNVNLRARKFKLRYSIPGNDVVFEPVVYEQGDSVGGTWVYQDQVSEGAGEEVHSR